MTQKSYTFGAVVLACVGCSRAPAVPDNPPPPGAPTLGPTTVLADAPPPISGATLLLSSDGATAVVADSDRDIVSFVDVASGTVRARATLSPHDEPGRLAEDANGFVHLALRGSGDLVTLSLSSGQITQRRPACAEPRGVAYDPSNDQVLVACATGELVTFAAASGPPVQVVPVEPDLRDIVVTADAIFVSKFRTAEILRLDRTGVILARAFLPAGNGSPALAWRMRKLNDQKLIASYQVDSTSFIPTTPGGYGGGASPSGPSPGSTFNGIITPEVAEIPMNDLSTSEGTTATASVLPVDVAVSQDGLVAAVVAAGNWKSAAGPSFTRLQFAGSASLGPGTKVAGQIVAAEIATDGTILLQSREPAALLFVQSNNQVVRTVKLSDVSREDTGHTIFHTNAGSSIACASCHGEGGDDAQTWNFDGTKQRRTPSLLGTIKGTAPYHWDADFADIKALLQEVYTKRMGGLALADDQMDAVKGWVEGLPAPKKVAVDEASRARGEALFHGAAACDTCHSGPSYTNNATVNVDTGLPLQVPPLVGIAARAPYLHTGCAQTLEERFTKCATASHGQTQALTTAQVGDLVTFLKSL